MALKSSKNGKVTLGTTDVPHARGWELNASADIKKYASSGTSGNKEGVVGHKDWNGSFTFYQDDTTDIEGIIREGDSITGKFYEDATSFWTGTILISSISLSEPIEEGDIVQGTVAFEGHGALTAPT